VPSRFSVEWTEAASRDLAEIIMFIARDSPSDAVKVYRRIRKRADTLRRFPGRGHVVPELASLDVVYFRELLVLPYRIVYRIDKSKVFVLAVLDGRRDLRQLLSERLLRIQ
jgi:plasmid stabilization system protein ParE